MRHESRQEAGGGASRHREQIILNPSAAIRGEAPCPAYEEPSAFPESGATRSVPWLISNLPCDLGRHPFFAVSSPHDAAHAPSWTVVQYGAPRHEA